MKAVISTTVDMGKIEFPVEFCEIASLKALIGSKYGYDGIRMETITGVTISPENLAANEIDRPGTSFFSSFETFLRNGSFILNL